MSSQNNYVLPTLLNADDADIDIAQIIADKKKESAVISVAKHLRHQRCIHSHVFRVPFKPMSSAFNI